MLRCLQTSLIPGHQIASGQNPASPYPAGSIALQMPLFAALGLDLSDCYPATLNLLIAPLTFEMNAPDHRFAKLAWSDKVPAETFSFVRCTVSTAEQSVAGWIYYPHPETKVRDFHANDRFEIIAPFLNHVTYGDAITLEFASHQISIHPPQA